MGAAAPGRVAASDSALGESQDPCVCLHGHHTFLRSKGITTGFGDQPRESPAGQRGSQEEPGVDSPEEPGWDWQASP